MSPCGFGGMRSTRSISCKVGSSRSGFLAMSKIHFHGRVHPTSVPVTMNDLILDITHPLFGARNVFIQIRESLVDVTCTPHHPQHTQQLFLLCMQMAQTAVDLG